MIKKKKQSYKNKKVPFFSVITVVKNNESKIKKTIDSILSQTFKNFEYIIIDGKSSDNSLQIINRYKKNIKKIVSQKDKGIYDAMNKGLNLSVGKVILYVNSGDILTKNALKIVYKIFSKNKNLDFVFGTVKRYYTKATIVKSGFNKKRLFYNFDFATTHSAGFFLKRISFYKAGIFKLKYKCSADYDLYMRVLIKHNMKGDYTNKEDLIGVVESGGFSSKLSFFDHLFEETKIRLNNKQNILLVFLIFINAVMKWILKKIF